MLYLLSVDVLFFIFAFKHFPRIVGCRCSKDGISYIFLLYTFRIITHDSLVFFSFHSCFYLLCSLPHIFRDCLNQSYLELFSPLGKLGRALKYARYAIVNLASVCSIVKVFGSWRDILTLLAITRKAVLSVRTPCLLFIIRRQNSMMSLNDCAFGEKYYPPAFFSVNLQLPLSLFFSS